MNRRIWILCAAAFVATLSARAQTASSKLEVQVSYTGAGTVDADHKVYVVLWDTPDFIKGDSGSMPVAMKGVSSKSDVVAFSDVAKGPVYISMMYDAAGKWDEASNPPSGSPLGLYAKDPGTPAPIELEPGKTAKISATFDDSFKMP